MTEQEAMTKWCPFARVVTVIAETVRVGGEMQLVSAAGNRAPLSDKVGLYGSADRLNPESARCIASRCMAWRWVAFTEFSIREAASKTIAERMVAEMAEYEGSAPMMVGGYCGLAGKP